MTSLAPSTIELAEALDTWLVVAREAMNEAHLMAARLADDLRTANTEAVRVADLLEHEQQRLAATAVLAESVLSALDSIADRIRSRPDAASSLAPISVRVETARVQTLEVLGRLRAATLRLEPTRAALVRSQLERGHALDTGRDAAGHLGAAEAAHAEAQHDVLDALSRTQVGP